MRTRRPLSLLAAALVLSLSGCGGDTPKTDPSKPPAFVTVDHILIGVENLKAGARSPGKRSAPQAKTVAYDLFAKLKAGGDWAAAKKEFSDDPPPGGPYTMGNFGERVGPTDFRRQDMAPAFGDVGFKLAVGELGIADHHPITSPFGYHIIKRVK